MVGEAEECRTLSRTRGSKHFSRHTTYSHIVTKRGKVTIYEYIPFQKWVNGRLQNRWRVYEDDKLIAKVKGEVMTSKLFEMAMNPIKTDCKHEFYSGMDLRRHYITTDQLGYPVVYSKCRICGEWINRDAQETKTNDE